MSTRISIKTIVPDTTLEINGTPEGTFISGSTIDVQLTDGVSTVTPTSIGVLGNTVTVEVPSGTSRSTAKLMKTGQTTSYRTGDDGDFEAGRATDFFTLAENNPFGNTNRFTDELGAQTYTNNIVIDWSTYDGSTVLGWYRVSNGVDINWTNALDNALLTSVATFTTGWRLPNVQELFSLLNFSLLANPLNYSPINLGTVTNAYWSGTNTTSQGYRVFNAISSVVTNALKTTTSAMRYIPCRVFTVTGTTLS